MYVTGVLEYFTGVRGCAGDCQICRSLTSNVQTLENVRSAERNEPKPPAHVVTAQSQIRSDTDTSKKKVTAVT